MPVTRVPYQTRNGEKSLASYISRHQRDESFDWEPNSPFYAEMEITSQYENRVQLMDTLSGTVYSMFVHRLVALVQEGRVQGAIIKGEWNVHKQGNAYAVKMVHQ